MDEKVRCQSCGMPLGVDFYGLEADGTQSVLYCKFCYVSGTYADPNMTLDKMIALSVDNMIKELHIPQTKAEELARDVIPQLKRWKTI